ncbi:sensor histidine kinase [Clostridium malenominatum]|uniref:histidine kinase n=1 Tax=Clostridium malenominatum TaxID=1539 RepID=A0ABN1J584_9CLOT
MRFDKYLADKRYSLLFYLLLMSFVSAVISLDSSMKVSMGNIIYLNAVSFIFFTLYLVLNYLFIKNYYKTINDIVKNNNDELFYRVPKPKSYEQKLFHHLLKDVYEYQNEKIQKLYDTKKDNEEFITSWVHQIKTPIAVSRLLIENSLNKPTAAVLSSLEEELDKVESYIEQALYYSKIDDFSKDYLINEVELDRVVKETVKKHAKTFINKKIKVEIENTELVLVTDKKWLSFVLDQILDNSLKYTNSGGKIKIYGIKNNRGHELTIEDNGIGIKTEDVDRIFDKGFTGYNGRENSKSTGFGLYLSKRLVRKLGHDIYVESKYREYTKIILIFPKLSEYLDVSR